MNRFVRGIVVLALAGGTAAPLNAQLRDHTFGGFVGVSLSKAGGVDVGGDSKLVTGTAVGAFLTVGFSRLLALEPQSLLVEKGIKSEEGGLRRTVKLTYIQIPLLAKLRFPMGPEGRVTGFLFAGPGIAYRVGCRLTLAQGGNELAGGCDRDGEADELRSFDSSMILGLGADIGRTTLSIRYDLGLTKLDQSAEANDIKNRALILLAGVRVGMNR